MFSCFPQMARSVQFNYRKEDVSLILNKINRLYRYIVTETWETMVFQEVTGQCWLIWQCCLSISVGRDQITSWISALQVIPSPADHSSIHKQFPKRAAQSITIAKQNRKINGRQWCYEEKMNKFLTPGLYIDPVKSWTVLIWFSVKMFNKQF